MLFQSSRALILAGLLHIGSIAIAVFMNVPSVNAETRWNQRLTLTVETPDGLKTASSTSEFRFWPNSRFLKGDLGNAKFQITGQALILELGEKKLFVLMEGIAFWPAAAMIEQGFRGTNAEYVQSFIDFDGPVALPRKVLPRFVIFEDILDSTSVQNVDPDDLQSTFGEGYRFVSLLIEAVDDTVNIVDIEQTLPWLTQYSVRRLCPPPQNRRYFPFCGSVSHGDFLATKQ